MFALLEEMNKYSRKADAERLAKYMAILLIRVEVLPRNKVKADDEGGDVV